MCSSDLDASRQAGRNLGEPGHHGFSAGQGGRAQHGGHFGSQSTAADQDEAISALRELVGGLQRHPATQTVSNQRGPPMSEGEQQIAHGTGMRTQ